MKKVIELCILVAILLAYILFFNTRHTTISQKEKLLFEEYGSSPTTGEMIENELEFDGI